MSKHANKERVTKAASLSTDVARWAEKQARTENRSFSNFVETLLQRAREAQQTGAKQDSMAQAA